MFATPEIEAKRARGITVLAENPEIYQLNAQARMASIDALPKAVRLLINEYGITAENLYRKGMPAEDIERRILNNRVARDLSFDLEL